MLWADRNTPVGGHVLPEVKEQLREASRVFNKSMSLIISEAIVNWLKKNSPPKE